MLHHQLWRPRAVPPAPWPRSNEDTELKAVLISRHSSYDETHQTIPSFLRGQVPGKFKNARGCLILEPGEEGFLIQRHVSTERHWVVVWREDIAIHIALDRNYVQIGSPFRLWDVGRFLDVKLPALISCGKAGPRDSKANNSLVQYRIRRRLFLEHESTFMTQLRYYDSNAVAKYFNFVVGDVNNMGPDSFIDGEPEGYLILEVMDGSQRHPQPWIGCPLTGPYQDFARASSIGIRFEWFRTAGPRALLDMLRKAITLIQLLQSAKFSEPLNGFEHRVGFRPLEHDDDPTPTYINRVLALQLNHLQQFPNWVPQPETFQEAPIIDTSQRNRWHMHANRLFSMNSFRLGPPDDKCDSCMLSSTDGFDVKCKRGQNDRACDLCTMFRRPCTFTANVMDQRLVMDRIRVVAFHHAINQVDLETPVRREEEPWELEMIVLNESDPEFERGGDDENLDDA
ncbi:Fc.00g044720.m01.CDS01 [Cosmosporella sp. VM-42]